LDCREFERLLPRFLAGDLREPELGRAVRHESSCRHCHEQATAGMRDPEQPLADPAWTAETLRRTLGADCRHIERSLAAQLDETLAPGEAERVERHLQECAACRALAGVLRALPEYYRAVPRLVADRAFTGAVMRRTAGREPRLRTLLRAFWRSPAMLWEGALACSLILTPLIGEPAATGARQLGACAQSLSAGLAAAASAPPAAILTGSPDSAQERGAPALAALASWSGAARHEYRTILDGLARRARPAQERVERLLADLGLLGPDETRKPTGGSDELQHP
jgi:hypothetical protein